MTAIYGTFGCISGLTSALLTQCGVSNHVRNLCEPTRENTWTLLSMHTPQPAVDDFIAKKTESKCGYSQNGTTC